MAAIAKVIVELALDKEFDYLVPEEMVEHAAIGMRVEVPFGKRVTRGTIVGMVEVSEFDGLKPLHGLVGEKPFVDASLIGLARWMADYYCAPLENAVRTILPAAVRRKGARFKEQLHVRYLPDACTTKAVAELRATHPRRAAVLEVIRHRGEVTLRELVNEARTTAATVRALGEAGFVEVGNRALLRSPIGDQHVLPTRALQINPAQEQALLAVCEEMDADTPGVVLLFGVTGSGKTEVYLQAIEYGRAQGRGAIVLVPEIALTPQTEEQFRSRFGDEVAVLHSSLSTGERHDEWHRIRDGEARVVVGARSALFAPVLNLGLIVVDEEHETSYKQEESPRYHARDVAVMRGKRQKVAVVLGTATPALESMYNATVGKYRLVRLPNRVDDRTMPHVRVVDMRAEARREGRVNVLSQPLVDAMFDRLNRGEQVILFLNRRGYSTSLICPSCGYVMRCEHCSVAMTYHRKGERLVCHLCGASTGPPQVCPEPDCRDPAIRYAGMGTQRVEDVVRRIFTRSRAERMDADTTTRKGSHAAILNRFRRGDIDILIGTQMIAKGLHFPNVTLVGVVFADASLHLPDFRAGERTFQLLTQVAGRAGRGDVKGEVYVQTFTPFHPAVQAARELNYELLFDQEIAFREELGYPPYTHLICVTLSGAQEALVQLTCQSFARMLSRSLPKTVELSDTSPAPLAKIKGRFRYQLMLKGPAALPMTRTVRDIAGRFTWPKDVRFVIDVDALSLL